MSCCQGSFPLGVRPGTARILVTELSGSRRINPTPATKPCVDLDTEVESVLSPEKLVSLHKCLRAQQVFTQLIHPVLPCLRVIHMVAQCA